MLELITIRVRVCGLVQGVFYRASTKSKALELGIRGWVQNNPDGSVSAELQHAKQGVLDEMLSWMSHGPASARVDKLDVQIIKSADVYPGFVIRH